MDLGHCEEDPSEAMRKVFLVSWVSTIEAKKKKRKSKKEKIPLRQSDNIQYYRKYFSEDPLARRTYCIGYKNFYIHTVTTSWKENVSLGSLPTMCRETARGDMSPRFVKVIKLCIKGDDEITTPVSSSYNVT